MSSALRRGMAFGLTVLIFWTLNPNVLAVASTGQSPQQGAPISDSPIHVTGESSTPLTDIPSQSEVSLTVTPTRLAIGQADLAVAQKIHVINQGSQALSVTVRKRDFTVGRSGAMVFQDQLSYSAADWLSLSPADFTVAPGAFQAVILTPRVPDNPEPGDHQIALIFMVPAGEGNGNIKINRAIGIPIYITAPGLVDDSAIITDLAAPGFAINGPVPITATVTNTGTVHRDFRADAPLQINAPGSPAAFPDFTVQRDSIRDISTTWDPPLMCICNPTVQFTNADGSVQSATVRVIVFPLHMVGVLVGVLLLLWLGMLAARRSYRASVRKAALAMSHPVGQGDG